ncbi:LacI family DNA-binding transcriptional regulator [Reichenbachiella ulvae]|uniref:LacI family transcriptional regulator n=1 Tax=Reichenbachiella ulvae TaxID=2980104 RepID=A0ABT3CYR5_9BACT|nr:LacI family DNA-binding transcriptional regulator [Reichenbachiella ulvae]MCV9388762.1 LacI family transcriptional regulator [Reichenbachiella ulvae]
MTDNNNIRIKDIAKLAGVSVGTVDRVIHKRGKVSEEVKEKIEKVLSETGYKPNLLARTLGSKKGIKIAVIMPNPEQDEYWALAFTGITQSLEDWSQYNLQIDNHFFDLFDSSSFREAAENALSQTPDGLVCAPIFHKETLEFFSQQNQDNIPYVLCNTFIKELSPISFIGQDLYQSGRLAGELISIGGTDKSHVAILHIQENIENSMHLKAKEQGLRDILEPKYEISSHDIKKMDPALIREQIEQILIDENLGGIFVSTSSALHEVASILENMGRSDIRLIGYDLLEKNLSYLKRGVINFLINQNPKRMTLTGIGHLSNHLLFQKELPENELFPLEIISRENMETYLNSRIH